MCLGGCGATNQQWQTNLLPLKLRGNGYHFIQGRRDQPTQADNVDLLIDSGFDNLVNVHHDTQVDHIVVVTLKYHANNVLADIVDITLDGSHENFAFGNSGITFFSPDVRYQMRNRLLHDPGTFYNLG